MGLVAPSSTSFVMSDSKPGGVANFASGYTPRLVASEQSQKLCVPVRQHVPESGEDGRQQHSFGAGKSEYTKKADQGKGRDKCPEVNHSTLWVRDRCPKPESGQQASMVAGIDIGGLRDNWCVDRHG
ncbi:hypothetical protein L208DRAFT_1379837 [Tricholoma matsutake]|nr:hypothetical protein L208DRAFT_1379837 [Tricholoma matsutake 945]